MAAESTLPRPSTVTCRPRPAFRPGGDTAPEHAPRTAPDRMFMMF